MFLSRSTTSTASRLILRPSNRRGRFVVGSSSTSSSFRTISSSQLTIERTTDSSRFDNRPSKEDLQFGLTMSDHMLTVEWTKDSGWGSPKIIPYQDLRIAPAASCLHYGTFLPVVLLWTIHRPPPPPPPVSNSFLLSFPALNTHPSNVTVSRCLSFALFSDQASNALRG